MTTHFTALAAVAALGLGLGIDAPPRPAFATAAAAMSLAPQRFSVRARATTDDLPSSQVTYVVVNPPR